MSKKNKVYKKAKRKAVSPWKGLAIFSGIMTLIFIPIATVVGIFNNTFAAFVGGSFWKLKNENPSVVYYECDFDSNQEMIDYGLDLCRRVEAEGASLLLNHGGALPLNRGSNVSLFSTSSVNLVYGGTGSGNIDASTADNLKSALEKEGFSVNPDLWNFYLSEECKPYYRNKAGTVSLASAVVTEVPWRLYSDDLVNGFSSYGDAAIVVFSRIGGEGADLEYKDVNYLALSEDEALMLKNVSYLKDKGVFKKLIVLINTANPLQMDFLKDSSYAIDSVLWIGDVGISGINAVASIIAGTVNPSGCLVDTYCYDNYSSPAMKNFIPTLYSGDITGVSKNADSYMIYQEGIYVGYKYYETRYEDFVMGTGNAGSYDYNHDVAFPFGYGLSYTDFEFSDFKVVTNTKNESLYASVKVTNTGKKYSGKKTVQIYFQAPYTGYDITNHIEKASVNLIGFGKTSILAPGASEVVTVKVNIKDMASYDAYGEGTYIIEPGEYYLTAAENAHQAVNNILSAKGFDPISTNGRMDVDGDSSLVSKYYNGSFDRATFSVSDNGTKIQNQLSSADFNLYEGNGGQHINYLTRSNWGESFPTEIVKIEITEKLKADLKEVLYNAASYPEAEMPVMNARNGVNLYDLMGKKYDDPLWDKLLDELSFHEMVVLIGDSFHWTMPVNSINAPGSRDENGPQGLTASLLQSDKTKLKATAFTSEDVMAATFNTLIMTEIGRVIGNNCVAANIMCLYGPGNNIHRTPYGGRNFEYYSEDGYLSGIMSAYEVKAIEDKGVHVVMKHFALNDCEQDRLGLGVWLTEQTARELYLKAFQAPFEMGNAGVMVAYTRFGPTWSGAHKGLMSGILRGEWGSTGLNITDNVLVKYVNGVDAMMAGGVSTFDAMMPYVTQQLPKYKKDAVIVNAMRDACHHTLYSLANSVAMNGIDGDTIVRYRHLVIEDFTVTMAWIFAILFVLSLTLAIRKYRKFRKTYTYSE